MISSFHAIILGIIQGFTEFLPISSSGHLVLIPYIFKWNYQGLSFDVALHAGTAIAIVTFFWKDWMAILKRAFSKVKTDDQIIEKYPRNLLWQILVASIPAMILGLTIDNYVEEKFHSIILISLNLIFFGFLLWFVDKKAESGLKPGSLTYGKSFIVGLFQAIALIPGVSRSGATLIAGRWIGLEREEAARFSFLLATPAIVGAFVLKLPDIKNNIDAAFLLAVLAATVSGIFAIKFLLNYLKKSDFTVFFWYRVAIAIVAMGMYIVR